MVENGGDAGMEACANGPPRDSMLAQALQRWSWEMEGRSNGVQYRHVFQHVRPGQQGANQLRV